MEVDGALSTVHGELLEDRSSNTVFPTAQEREEVLRGMLEWACCELSPSLFDEVVAEIGPENVKETIFTKVHKLFVGLNDSKRDPDEVSCLRLVCGKPSRLIQTNPSTNVQQLEKLFDAFESTLVRYEGEAVKLSKAVNHSSDILLWELKVQICLGRLLQDGDVTREKLPTNQSALTTGTTNFGQALQDYFLDFDGATLPAQEKKYFDKALADLDKLNSLCAAVQSAGPKVKKQKTNEANAHLSSVVKDHGWESFLGTVRLYCSTLLYSCHRGPVALAAVRDKTVVKNLPEEVVVQQGLADSSTRCKLLTQTFFEMGGNASEWHSITEMTEADGQVFLANILEHAHKNGKPKAPADEDEDVEGASEDEDDEVYGKTAMSPAVLLSEKKAFNSQAKRRRRSTLQDAVSRNLEDLYGYSDENSLKMAPGGRKRPVLWTLEETSCLAKGVKEHGTGKWAKILNQYRHVFEAQNRTSVSLKDRWRNLENAKKRKENK